MTSLGGTIFGQLNDYVRGSNDNSGLAYSSSYVDYNSFTDMDIFSLILGSVFEHFFGVNGYFSSY